MNDKGVKCLNPKCEERLHSYDCTCPACGLDNYYKFHYGTDVFYHAKTER